MTDVRIDEAALFGFLNDEHGPVGAMLLDLSERAAVVARARVRVRGSRGGRTGLTSDARPPGFTRASIRTDVNKSGTGRLFGGIGAAENPAIFLEEPAEQLERRYPFLTTGVYSLEGQV